MPLNSPSLCPSSLIQAFSLVLQTTKRWRSVLTEAKFKLSGNAIADIRRNIKTCGIIDFFEEEDEHKLFLQEKGVALIGFLEGGSLCRRGACLGKIVVVAPSVSERNALLQDAEAVLEDVLPFVSYG